MGGKELEAFSVNDVASYRAECLSFTMESQLFERTDPALHASSRELLWSHHLFDVNQFYVEGRSEFAIEGADCFGHIGNK